MITVISKLLFFCLSLSHTHTLTHTHTHTHTHTLKYANSAFSHGYVFSIASALQDFLSDQTHIVKISF